MPELGGPAKRRAIVTCVVESLIEDDGTEVAAPKRDWLIEPGSAAPPLDPVHHLSVGEGRMIG